MFEEMTYDFIMAQMMAEMPDGIDTSEGSLLYHACAKQAVRLEEVYLRLGEIEKNMFIDTADLDHLIRLGADRGIPIQYATFSEFLAQFNLSVQPGTRFTGGDYNYTVLDAADEAAHIYTVVCDSPGKEPNRILTDLTPLEYLEGFETGKILECIKEGTDMESESVYRERIRVSLFDQSSGGSRKWYLPKLKQYIGVGGAKLARVRAPEDVITATILSADYGRPTEKFIEELQTYVDPVVNGGDGYGIAPVGHRVTVLPVEETRVDVSAAITYETDISYEDVGNQIEAVIEEYLLSLRKEWEDSESLVVRIVQIEAALVSIPGILDVSGTQINGQDVNLVLPGTIPVKGEVRCV